MLKRLLGQLAGARRASAATKPDPANVIGPALEAQARGQWAQAETILRAGLTTHQRHVDLLHLLATNLIAQGKHREARQFLEQVLTLEPNRVEAHFHLAQAHGALGNNALAESSLLRTLELRPEFAEAMNNLANVQRSLGNIDSAERWLLRAIELKPEFAEAAYNLGRLLHQEGRIPEALHYHRLAFTTNPSLVDAHSNYLYWLNFDPSCSPAAVFDAHLQWARSHAEPLLAERLAHANLVSANRKLRVGYVSPNFKDHAAAYFFVATLEHYDPDRQHVICYSDAIDPDRYTQRIRAASSEWRDTATLTDAALANLIQRDQIDILVDLSGHTEGNRLLAFARKPAPLQITWNGYANTTGMTTMDYRITDARADPPGLTEHLHTESLLRMPDTYMAFDPPPVSADVNSSPALRTGNITFASFNAITKITPVVAKTWSRILLALPTATLLLAALPSASARKRMLALFAQYGIGAERIRMHGLLPRAQFLELHRDADIALDPFPFHGTTTTCHSLWMGLPVITLAGQSHVSRVGVSMLTSVSLPELIAQSEDEYVDIALRLARDPEQLGKMRSGMRARMLASPLTDGARFARNLEAVYRNIWRDWCRRQTPAR